MGCLAWVESVGPVLSTDYNVPPGLQLFYITRQLPEGQEEEVQTGGH